MKGLKGNQASPTLKQRPSPSIVFLPSLSTEAATVDSDAKEKPQPMTIAENFWAANKTK